MEWLSRLRFKDSTITDMSGTTWTNNGATFVEGKFGAQAINIDTGFLTSDKAISLLATEKWTISFWNKMISTLGYTVILGDSAGSRYSIQNYNNGPGLGMRINSTGYNISDENYNNTINTWKHVAFVNDGTNLRLFVDGALKQSIVASTFSLSTNMLLGNWGYSQKGTPGYIDDFCIIKGEALWTQNFTPPTDYILNAYKAYLTEDDKLYGKVNNVFTKLSDNYSTMTSADAKAAIISTTNQYANLTDLQSLSNKVKTINYSLGSSTVYNSISVVNKDTLIIPKGLISLKSIEGIDKVSINKSITGTGACRLLVTNDLTTYKTFDGTNFVDIDHTDIALVKTNGINISALSTITREKWDTLTVGKNGIGFAYLPTIEDITDTCNIADISMTADMKGSWDRPPNYNDATYKYPTNDTLRVVINSDGSYKINYKE